MMRIRSVSVLAGVAAATLLCGCGGGGSTTPSKTTSYSELAKRLTDLRSLADLSQPGAGMVSSYDRTGKNNDYNNPLRVTPDGWAVIADLKGPGYISRFWFTGPPADGNYPLRFFFDDEKEPRIDTTIGEFFGGKEPFIAPLACFDPFCWYSYAPIPYHKRLIVMTRAGGTKPDGNPKIFYQINFNSPPAGTTVESFPKVLTPEIMSALTDARAKLAVKSHEMPLGAATTPKSSQGIVAPGASFSADLGAGPAIVREVKIGLDLANLKTDFAKQQAMRELTLKIFWDGAAEPSVLVPFGDFFGSVWQRRQFSSVYFGLTGDTFYTRFPMPFEKSARIEVANGMGEAIPVSIETQIESLPSWATTWGYFHARWSKTTPEQVGQPHPFADATGRGRFAGVILSTMSADRSWWMLEGDETISADDDSFPRWHGTGLEDYFNGGWYYGSAIIRPFNGLPYKAQFRTIQYRIHHTDPVDFQKQMRALLERGPDNASHGALESVAFYYLDKPTAAASRLGDATFRLPPQDAMAGATVMSEINEYERLGDLRGAKEYIGSILERAAGYPYADVLRLRLLAYDARDNGFASVAERIAQIAQTSSNAVARKQADDLKWFYEDDSHAILGTYCNAKTQVFLDGNAITASGNPERFEFTRVKLTPGAHALALRAQNRPYPFWCLASLQTRKGEIVTQADWRYEHADSGNWAAASFDDSAWKVVGGPALGKGPPEEPYIFLEPHAFPGLQARARGIWLPSDWASPSPTVVFRKNFTTP